MKTIIVLLATVVLGISLAGTVTGMGTNIDGVKDDVIERIDTVFTTSGSAVE